MYGREYFEHCEAEREREIENMREAERRDKQRRQFVPADYKHYHRPMTEEELTRYHDLRV